MSPKITYVSGAYSADTAEQVEENVKIATRIGIDLMEKGHYVIIPHLSHYTELLAQEYLGQGFSWNRWMEVDLAILERCDALFYIGPSKGADIEKERALDLGLEVWTKIDEVPVVK